MEINLQGTMYPINIVGKIEAKDPPKGALFCIMSPDKKFIQLFYRIIPVKFNDGTTAEALQYWSNFDCWRGTNESDIPTFLKTREFYQITNTP